MSLTADEKVAGRAFREVARQWWEVRKHELSPQIVIPPFLVQFRHSCVGEVSRSMPMREWFLRSAQAQVGDQAIPEGRFGFVFRQGKCSACHTDVLSYGRVVDAWERPARGGGRVIQL